MEQGKIFLKDQLLVKIESDIRKGHTKHHYRGKAKKFKKNRTWTKNQISLFAAFLYYNHWRFQSQETKKRWKVYKSMSSFIQTKNINQCRTYSNKLMKTFKDVKRINQFFRNSIPQYQQVVASLQERNTRMLGDEPDNSQSSQNRQVDDIQLDDNSNSVQNYSEEPVKIQEVDHQLNRQVQVVVPQPQYPTGKEVNQETDKNNAQNAQSSWRQYCQFINTAYWNWWWSFNPLTASHLSCPE